MARALLREHQIGDRDNLSEDEHDILVHENLVTSGTLNFQDGTVSGTGNIFCDNLYANNVTTPSGIVSGCSVKLSSSQTIPSQTWETIEFDSELFDLNNEFNTSTHTFTAKQDGYYLVSVHHIYAEGVPIDYYFNARVFLNGVSLWNSKLPPGDLRTNTGIDITGIVHLEVDDYINAQTYHHYDSDRNLNDETNIFIWRLDSVPYELGDYYTKTEVDDMMTTMSGALQSQIDELLAL